jgi:hypothetical protein
MKKVLLVLFSLIGGTGQNCEKKFRLQLKAFLFLLVFFILGSKDNLQAQTQIYFTNYQTTPTVPSSGTASWTLVSGAFSTTALTGWAGGYSSASYPSYFQTSSSTGNVLLTFSTPLTLYSNGVDRGSITITWGHTSTSKNLAFAVNGSTVATYTSNATAKTLQSDTYTIPTATSTISTIKCTGSSTTGMTVFSVSVNTYLAPPTLSAASSQSVDNNFNLTFTDNPTWRGLVTGITVDGTSYLAASGAYTLTSGSLVLSRALINELHTAGSHTVVAFATGYGSTSVTQTNIAGAAAKLNVNTQPAAPTYNGFALATQPVVTIQDQYSNATTSTASVSATVGSGTYTIGGTNPKTAVAGTATFTDLTVTSAASATGATITFTSTGLTSATSTAFNIAAPEFMSVNSTGAATTENFNTIGSTATAALPSGWHIDQATTWGAATNTVATTVAAGSTGTGAVATNSTGGAYNFADGATASSTDRAIGFLTSGSYTSPRSILLRLKNTTGSTITSLSVAFDYEKYRDNTSSLAETFFHSSDGSTWTSASSGDQSYVAGTASVINPPTTNSKSFTLSGLSILNNSFYYFRWTYTGSASASSQAVGIDNFSITPLTVSTGTISGSPFCAGSSVSVPYNTYTTFNGGNTFTAQLSDASGSFSSPATLGTVSSTSSGTINGTIPTNTSTGSGYRIRVVSDNPSYTGTDNGISLTVTALPSITSQPSNAISYPGTDVNSIFTVATSAGSPTYQWQYSADGLTNWASVANGTPTAFSYTNATTASLTVATTSSASTGTNYYRAMVTSGGCSNNSNAASLTLNTPASPTTTSIAPSSATEGDGGFTLTVNGTNFISGISTVLWGGAARTSSFVSATQLTATIPATDVQAGTAGSVNVTVQTTGAVSASNAQTFTINAATSPLLTAGTLTGFGNNVITQTSSAHSFTLAGGNLDGSDIAIGPLTGYSFATASNGTYGSTVTLSTAGSGGDYTYAGGSLSGATIYVKFSPSAIQSYNGNIAVAGGNATTVNVSVTGSGIASTASSVSTQGGYSYSSNIDYSTLQSASSLTTGNSTGVAGLTLNDASGANSDGLSTTLTDITFTIPAATANTLRTVALFDGPTNLAEVAVINGTTTIGFSGLTISANDAGTKNFELRATFKSTVTDNYQMSFTVSSVTAQAGGSSFAASNGGAAASSTTGDLNRIEVTASQLIYTTSPPSAANVSTNVSPSPVVTAKDVNNNVDLDFSYTGLAITNSGSLGMSNTPATPTDVSNGVLTFPSSFQFTAPGTVTLSVAATGVTTATSTNITVTYASVSLGQYLFASSLAVSSPNANLTFANVSPSTITGTTSSGYYELSLSPNWGAAVSTSAYIQFTVTPAAGQIVTPTSLTFQQMGTSAGATNFVVRSSADNYATNLGSGVYASTISTGAPSVIATVSLSGGSFTDVATALTFRIYPYGGSASGNFRVDNLTLNGYVVANPNPYFTVSSSSLSLAATNVGANSASQNFNLSGANLTGAPGSVTASAPSTDFQVSSDNTTFGATATIAYSSATLSASPVYVRFTPQSQGTKTGNISFSGGGVTTYTQTVAVSGTSSAGVFYSKSSGNLDALSTWGTNTDGTGIAPLDFVTNSQTFNVVNNASATIGAAWTVSGTSSKVVVGDATNTINFTIPSSFTLTGTVDVTNHGTLTIQHTTVPTLGTLSPGSTVDYAASSGTQAVAAASYTNLTLSGSGTRTFSGTANISGIFTPGSGFSSAGGTIVFTGSSQSIPAFTYSGLQINGTGTAVTTGNITVNAILTVTTAFRVSSSTSLTLGSSGTILTTTGVLTIAGTVNNPNTSSTAITSTSSTLIFSSSSGLGVYNLTGNGGQIPAATYTSGNGNSTINVTGLASSATVTATSGTSSFGNLVYDNPSWTGSLQKLFTNSGSFATPVTIAGDLTLGRIGTATTQMTSGATFIINVSGNLNVYAGTWQLMPFSGSNGTASLNITGNLNIDATYSFPATGYTAPQLLLSSARSGNAGNLSVGGGITLTSGTNTAILSQSLGTATLTINGSGTQTVTGMTGTSVSGVINMVVNKASNGITLGSDMTIPTTGNLTLTDGIVTTGSYKVIMPSTGTVTRTNGWVAGNFQKNIGTGSSVTKTFEIGGPSSYRPVTVLFASVGTAGNLTASVTQSAGEHPSISASGIAQGKDVNVYYSLINSGIVFTGTYDATFTYVAGDRDGAATAASFIVRQYNATIWSGTTSPINTGGVSTKATCSILANGVTNDFVIGEANNPPTFDNGTPQTLNVCQDASATSINSLLTATDADAGQTLTWTVTSAPSHGSIGGGGATASSGTNVTPSGLTYTPTASYSGSDAFTIQVSDGAATATTVINVTVSPTTVGGSIAGSATVCSNSNSGTLTLSGHTGTITKWQYSNDNFGSDVHDIANTTTSQNYSGLTETTYYRALVQSGVCSSALSSVATITVNTAINISAQPATATICSGGTSFSVTASGTISSYQWQMSTDNGSNYNDLSNGGVYGTVTTNTLNISDVAGLNNNRYRVLVSGTSPCGNVTSNAAILMVGNTWTGTTNSDWNTSGNWQCGSVPTSSDNVFIPNVTTKPVLTGNIIIGNIMINTGSTLDIGAGNTLTISGAVSGSGTISGSSTSNLILTAAAGTLNFTPGSNTLQNLSLNNSATATIGSALNIVGGASFGTVTVNAGATLTTGGNLTLKSDINGTARVATLSTGVVSGNLTAERFLGENTPKKAWRLLSSPIEGTTIQQAWQDGGGSTNNPGYGTRITGTQTGNGFDSGNPSIKTWNGSAWVTNQLTATNAGDIKDYQGYFVFVRGDRSVTTGVNQTATNTTVRPTGTLRQGNMSNYLTVPNTGGFTLMGNPYASAIDFEAIHTDNTDLESFYAWDPNQAGTYGVGGYNIIDRNGGSYEVTPSTGGTGANATARYIPQGIAVLIVNPSTAPSPVTITMKESYKVANTTTINYFRTTSANMNMAVNLSTTASQVIDGVRVRYDAAFSNNVTGEDIGKLYNNNENIAISRSNQFFIVEKRAAITQNDTVFLRLSGMQQQAYQLIFYPANFSGVSQAYLEDSYLNTSTPISVTNNTTVTFTVDANGTSTGDRFRIVFKPSATLPVTFTGIKAYEKGSSVQVEWSVANESGIKTYEVERSVNGREFYKIGEVAAKGNNNSTASYSFADVAPLNGSNYYRIKSIGADGVVKYTSVVRVNIGKGDAVIAVYPNPVKGDVVTLQLTNLSKGTYSIRVINNAGQIILNQQLNHGGGSSSEQLVLPPGLSKGNYHLEVSGKNTNIITQIVLQ